MPRQPYSEAVLSDRRSGYIPCPLRGKVVQMSAMKARFQIAECSQPSPWEKGLGKSGGAFLKGKEGRVGFRRTLKVQGSTGRFFEKTPSAASFIKKEKIIYNNQPNMFCRLRQCRQILPKLNLSAILLLFLIKRAALGNLKANFHCAHLHRFFPLKKGLSKTYQSSLNLKGGSTSHLGLLQ